MAHRVMTVREKAEGQKEKGKRRRVGGEMRPTHCPTLEMICLLDEVFP
jgi:hypothetical protein